MPIDPEKVNQFLKLARGYKKKPEKPVNLTEREKRDIRLLKQSASEQDVPGAGYPGVEAEQYPKFIAQEDSSLARIPKYLANQQRLKEQQKKVVTETPEKRLRYQTALAKLNKAQGKPLTPEQENLLKTAGKPAKTLDYDEQRQKILDNMKKQYDLLIAENAESSGTEKIYKYGESMRQPAKEKYVKSADDLFWLDIAKETETDPDTIKVDFDKATQIEQQFRNELNTGIYDKLAPQEKQKIFEERFAPLSMDWQDFVEIMTRKKAHEQTVQTELSKY
jgi:hypothetical protein